LYGEQREEAANPFGWINGVVRYNPDCIHYLVCEPINFASSLAFDINRRDEKLWDLLDYVAGFDTEVSPGEYLFHEEDIKDWIRQFEKK
jgi:hypothetical protein